MNDKKESIFIKNIQTFKQIIKDKSYNNYEFVEPLMINGNKQKHSELKAPKWFSDFVNEQRLFNNMIIKRLDEQQQSINELKADVKNLKAVVVDLIETNNLKLSKTKLN